jgi:hypothetical protein
MTTRNEALEEFKEYLEYKKQEYSDEADESAMQLQEDSDHPESEFYENSKYEYEKVLKNLGEINQLIADLEEYLINK